MKAITITNMLTGILLVCQGTNLKNRHDNSAAVIMIYTQSHVLRTLMATKQQQEQILTQVLITLATKQQTRFTVDT